MPTLPKKFRPATRNTLVFIWPNKNNKNPMVVSALSGMTEPSNLKGVAEPVCAAMPTPGLEKVIYYNYHMSHDM